MKQVIAFLVAVLLIAFTLFSCNQLPAVDKDMNPQAFFSQYEVLTSLYGTPWRDTLEKIGVGLSDVTADGLSNVLIPQKEDYAGVTFDVFLRFGGSDNHFSGVRYSATYADPEDEEQMLRDLVKINRKLIDDLGDSFDTSFVFNWVENSMGENWNREIPYWQDMQVIKRLIDNDFGGYLLRWNLDSIANAQIKSLGVKHSLRIDATIDKQEGTATISIYY